MLKPPTRAGQHEKPRTYRTGPRYRCFGVLHQARQAFKALTDHADKVQCILSVELKAHPDNKE